MTMQLARLEIRRSDGVLIADVSGEIDMSNAGDLRNALTSQLTNQSSALIIDLSGVSYLDSAAIHVIYELAERLAARLIHFSLVLPPSAAPLAALRLSGVPDVVPILPTVAEAEAGLPSDDA